VILGLSCSSSSTELERAMRAGLQREFPLRSEGEMPDSFEVDNKVTSAAEFQSNTSSYGCFRIYWYTIGSRSLKCYLTMTLMLLVYGL